MVFQRRSVILMALSTNGILVLPMYSTAPNTSMICQRVSFITWPATTPSVSPLPISSASWSSQTQAVSRPNTSPMTGSLRPPPS